MSRQIAYQVCDEWREEGKDNNETHTSMEFHKYRSDTTMQSHRMNSSPYVLVLTPV